MENSQKLFNELQLLKAEHEKVADELVAVLSSKTFDQLKIQRLKKKKLALKDRIAEIEETLYPDIIA